MADTAVGICRQPVRVWSTAVTSMPSDLPFSTYLESFRMLCQQKCGLAVRRGVMDQVLPYLSERKKPVLGKSSPVVAEHVLADSEPFHTFLLVMGGIHIAMAAHASEKGPSSMTCRVFQLSMIKYIDMVFLKPRWFLKDTIASLQEYHNNTARTAGGTSSVMTTSPTSRSSRTFKPPSAERDIHLPGFMAAMRH
eukprot:scaffold70721_cov14-Prasinocladus_malaysianus.AAC.3